MPPLPVIAGVYRVRMDFSLSSGVQPVNIFHIGSNLETAAEIADLVEDAADNSMIAPVGNQWDWLGVTITPLDGVTASQSFTFASPLDSGNAGQPVLNLAAMVEFSTLVRGSRGRGRLFLGPTTESTNVGNNVMDAGTRTVTLGGWNAFEGALLAAESSLGVASYVHASIAPIQSIGVDATLRSAKSRLNQILR